MTTVEQELWNIFTYYTLNGNPRDPGYLVISQFLRICRDCRMMEPGMSEVPLNSNELPLICRAETIRRSKTGNKVAIEKISFSECLTCLMKISRKMYPSSDGVDDAFQQLLMDNILPLAHRRQTLPITANMAQIDVQDLYASFRDAIQDLFQFYATSSMDNRANKMMVSSVNAQSTSLRASSKSSSRGANHKKQKPTSKKTRGHTPSSSHMTRSTPAFSHTMGYGEFLRFAHDFGFMSVSGLTSLECGDIYLSAISTHSDVRDLEFDEFWEVLVRCALTSFKHISTVTTSDKIKAMFMFMWKTIQVAIPDSVSGELEGSDQNIYKAAIIRASSSLNEKFLVMWAEDEYKDYLAEIESNKPQVRDILNDIGQMQIQFASEHGTGDMGGGEDENGDDDEMGVHSSSNNQPTLQVDIMIEDDDELGDDRIDPRKLRRLLEKRPDLAVMLYKCILELNPDS